MVEAVRNEQFEELPEDADIPVFIIRGDDPLCGLIVQQYSNRLEQAGLATAEMLASIRNHANYMQEFYNDILREVSAAADAIEREEMEEADEESYEGGHMPDMYFGSDSPDEEV